MKRIPKLPTPRKKLNSSARTPRRAADEAFYDDEPNMKLSRAFVVVLILHVVAVAGILIFNNMKTGQTFGAAELGLTDPVAIPDTPAAEAGSLPRNKYHFLRAGETLTRVAGLYGVTIPDLVRANNLRNDSTLQIGQRLLIPQENESTKSTATANPDRPPLPAMGSEPAAPVVPARLSTSDLARGPVPPPAAATAGSTTGSALPADSGQTYTVVKGDNPVAIARGLEVNYQDLLDLNQISDPRLLQIGQVLKVPVKR